MTESLIQRIEKAEKELAAIKAEATKVPKVVITDLVDGLYVCLNACKEPRMFLVEGGHPDNVMGVAAPDKVICTQARGHELQGFFDRGFYHSLKRVTSLAPLL